MAEYPKQFIEAMELIAQQLGLISSALNDVIREASTRAVMTEIQISEDIDVLVDGLVGMLENLTDHAEYESYASHTCIAALGAAEEIASALDAYEVSDRVRLTQVRDLCHWMGVAEGLRLFFRSYADKPFISKIDVKVVGPDWIMTPRIKTMILDEEDSND